MTNLKIARKDGFETGIAKHCKTIIFFPKNKMFEIVKIINIKKDEHFFIFIKKDGWMDGCKILFKDF